MKKLLACLAFVLLPSTALADVGPVRHLDCEECPYRCYDCCRMEEIVPMPGCSSCYHSDCNWEEVCAKYLADNPNECPEKNAGSSNGEATKNADDEKTVGSANDAANPQADSNEMNDKSQVPPPVESKRSCSALLYASEQPSVWALLLAFVLSGLIVVRRRVG